MCGGQRHWVPCFISFHLIPLRHNLTLNLWLARPSDPPVYSPLPLGVLELDILSHIQIFIQLLGIPAQGFILAQQVFVVTKPSPQSFVYLSSAGIPQLHWVVLCGIVMGEMDNVAAGQNQTPNFKVIGNILVSFFQWTRVLCREIFAHLSHQYSIS